MEGSRFDRLTRGRARRPVLLAAFAVLGAAGLAGPGAEVARGKKKRCKKKCPRPFRCADCPAACSHCYQREDASPLCGGLTDAPTICDPCNSDGDCAGTGYPYCLVGSTIKATGQTQAITCLGFPGACRQILGCG
jgi:hypothetical protein